MTESLSRAIHESDTRVVIVGGGVAGLTAARECARPGFHVTVLEATGAVGGSVARAKVAGITVDVGAESFATRGGHVAALIDELGLSANVVQPNSAGAWLQLRDRAVELPAGGLLGIPASPLAKDVIAAIGWRGALRAYLDRLMPVLKIGHERNFGALVRRRMGRAVLEDLVTPVVSGVYSADPNDLDVLAVAPGLSRALTQLGSLSGAVTDLRSSAKPGSAVGGLAGGMTTLVDALAADAQARGVDIRLNAPVNAIGAGDEARWAVDTRDDDPIAADVVLIAVPAETALELISAVAGGTAFGDTAGVTALGWPAGTPIELVTLVLDAAGLDSAPRGTGVLVASQTRAAGRQLQDAGTPVGAKALTHSSAKWSWLAHELVAGRHVVRLSYGRVGERLHTLEMSDGELRDCAMRDASMLLNIPLTASDLRGYARTSWLNQVSPAMTGQRQRIDAVRAAVEALDGLEIAGSWIAGTGLASVIPDAKEAAERVRALRWKTLTEKE